MALVSYLSAVGMVVLAAAVAINRDRAKSLLIGATAVTVFISLASLLRDLFGLNVLAMRDEARDCACLGVTLTAACAMLVFERHETRRSGTSKTRKKFPVAMAACLIAFVICAAAVWATRAGSLAFAAVSGFLTFIAIVGDPPLGSRTVGRRRDRRHRSGHRNGFECESRRGDPDPRFAFVKKDALAIELTQRILNDAPFLATGPAHSPHYYPCIKQ